MKLQTNTVRKIIRILRDGSDAAERVADFFFDSGDGPHDDLMREAGESEAMAAELESRLEGTWKTSQPVKQPNP